MSRTSSPAASPSSSFSSSRAHLGGLLVTAGAHALVLFALVVSHGGSEARAARAPTVISTKLVRLGKPRPPGQLPRRFAAPPPTAPRRVVTPVPSPAPPRPAPPVPADAEPGEKPAADVFSRVRQLGGDPDLAPEGHAEGVAGGTADQAEGDPYAAALHALLLESWHVPELVADLRGLTADVFLRARADGGIVERRIAKTSGDRFFDASVLEAVDRVRKLPPPPPHWQVLLDEGVVLAFSPTPAP